MIEIRVGQIWADRDKHKGDRRVRVVALTDWRVVYTRYTYPIFLHQREYSSKRSRFPYAFEYVEEGGQS